MWEKVRQWALLQPPHSLSTELNPWGSQWKQALWFWAVLIALLIASHSLARAWVFEYAGLLSGDALTRLRSAEPAEKTGVVAITGNERQDLLSGLAPIPASKLEQAICAVLSVKPKVLGVDLDTSHVVLPWLPKTSTKIVWARGVRISRALNARGNDELKVEQDYVLGKSLSPVLSGLALAPVMPDWSVREIPMCYEYAPKRSMPTMVSALIGAAGMSVPDCLDEGKSRRESFEVGAYRIHYRYDRFTLTDFEKEPLDKAALDQCQRGEDKWGDDVVSHHPLAGRVILLGGEYDPQDWHQTPWGEAPGVEVLASVTEHLLQGSSGHEIDDWQEWAAKLALALCIAWVHSRFRPIAALVVCLLGLGGLILTGGLLAVYFTAYRASTVPFLLGITLEQLVTSAHKAQKGMHAINHGDVPPHAGAGGSEHLVTESGRAGHN